MAKYIFLIGLIISAPCFAQVRLTGVTVDASNNEVLPYVNIGVRNKNIGVISTENGEFTFSIPPQLLNDTLTFSMVGYEELNIPVNAINPKQRIFALKKMPLGLKEVKILSKRLSEKKYGLHNYHPLLHFYDGSTNQNDIFEIAQLVQFGETTSKITSVNLYINESADDSATFRINFYSYDGSKPGKRCVEKNITQTHKIQKGWLKFDIAPYAIKLKGDVVVAIEFIPSSSRKNSIAYEIKPGGRIKSYVRSHSIGTWQTPPHQYRMFVAALGTSDDKMIKADSEQEAVPAFRMFSKAVNDSFFIFLRLPKDYYTNIDRSYSVVYVLDANLYFSYLRDSLDKVKGDQPILIGIGYRNFVEMDSLRDRDYTYPVADASDSMSVSGGADKFYQFISDELMPTVNKLYRTDKSYCSLIGHSFGGYFTLYALYKDLCERHQLFRNYIAASPSIDFHNQYLLKQFEACKEKSDTAERSLFITWGALEDTDYDKVKFSDAAGTLISLLSQESYHPIKLRSFIYPGADHMETAIPSFYSGLHAIIKNGH